MAGSGFWGRKQPFTATVPVRFPLAWLALACALLFAFAARAETVTTDARVGGDAQRTRFVADLSKAADFRLFTLADPYRLIIDLPDVKFQLPAGLGREGRGLVSAYRYGLIAEGKARVVIDLESPATVEKAHVLPAKDGQPARLVIDLVKTDRNTFLAAMQKEAAAQPRSEPAKPIAPASAQKPKSAKPVVVIDPGHGGIDPGAISRSGEVEKDLVLSFSLELAAKLRSTGKYEVVLTRGNDTFIPLRRRVEIAQEKGGDLFLSIHADSLPGRFNTSVSGATVYTLSENASDDEARALAAKENKSDILAGVDLPADSDDVLASILIDLAQQATNNMSSAFAVTVLDGVGTVTKVHSKGHRVAGFRVLRAPDIPSILLELGYLSHPEDTKRLTNPEWRSKVAASLATAVDRFFDKRIAKVPHQ
ncbi:MAG: N-acetylmuramoyl-L-alanine amidase [Pseudomonadota bacterium]|nr:N-acetylmuramoyl-L-alanine amidase [Pseudomonadota bacterium]